jgi:CBS domain-containing protein
LAAHVLMIHRATTALADRQRELSRRHGISVAVAMLAMNVSNLMTSQVNTIAPDARMDEAVRLMAEQDIGCLPVIDGDGCVVGIVTDRDICLIAASRDVPMSALPVTDAMSEDVVAVSPSTTLEQAEWLLRDRQLHRLPVIDDDRRVVGMISLNDIAQAAAAQRWQGDEGLSPRDVGRTVAAIAERRTTLAVTE